MKFDDTDVELIVVAVMLLIYGMASFAISDSREKGHSCAQQHCRQGTPMLLDYKCVCVLITSHEAPLDTPHD